ncbi:MAG: ABC transporter substrate-binding protein [Opitutales bacterium]|nr:ABC transporter substrate-binding protein [Opitutales bacterium]
MIPVRLPHARLLMAGLPALVLVFLAGCSCSTQTTWPEEDITEEELAHYAANPDFFVYKTIDDLPADLPWTRNDHLPEIGSPKAIRGGTYRARIQDFPRTLRLYGPDSNSSFRPFLLDDIAIRLGHLHPNNPGDHEYYPGLALEWAPDPDTRTVYIRLDPKARWSDGKPVTTEDFFFMFFMFQSPHIRAPWYNNYYGVGVTYDRIIHYDERTFAITMAQLRPDFVGRVLNLVPLPRHFFRELGPDYVQRFNWRFAPTTGAYILTPEELERSRRNRGRITFVRQEDWWANDKPNLRYRFNPDRIRIRVIRDTPKAFELFLAGEMDMFGMNQAEFNFDRLPDHHPLVERGLIHKATFYNDVPRPTWGLWINSARPHLDNNDVRIGINYAANWDLVIQQFFRGEFFRMQTTADGYGSMTHPGIRARPFDPNRAMEHFARAGFTRRGPDGILVNEAGQRLSFNLSTGSEALAGVLTILREEARKAGLDFRIEILDASSNWRKVQEKNHDIALSAFGVSVEMFPRYWETYHSSNAFDVPFLEDGVTPNPDRRPREQTNNLESIAIAELDALIERYDRSESLDEMRELAFKMEEILHEHASFVPGFYMPFFRTAYWRWVQWPDDFNVRFARDPVEMWLFWFDEEKHEETRGTRRGSETFPPSVRIFDHWAVPPREK